MLRLFKLILILFGITILNNGYAQIDSKKILQEASLEQQKKERELAKTLVELATKNNWKLILQSPNQATIAILTGVNTAGFPIYTTTFNNTTAAATTRTNQLWTGGSTGLNLSGSSSFVNNKLAIWDGAKVMPNHIELTGRITQRDISTSNSSHSTHVAGTMIATGINPNAKGMAFGIQNLDCYDFTNHLSEMLGAASNLLVSNHSYGSVAGWRYTGSNWEFYGDPNTNEDYKFGFYNDEAQMWDSIVFNAPKYLIVKSVGNNKNENGPAVGQPYFRFDVGGNMVAAGNRPNGISNNDGYDIIPTYGSAKNILTIGSINGLEGGYSTTNDVVLSAMSSWGPTDDGRIKPDLVANGVDVLSTTAASTSAYETYSGTSMSTPNVSGSLLLIQELYAKLNGGQFLNASTLKAIAIHAADEAGPSQGPDYMHGWGLFNAEKSAEIVSSLNVANHRIIEQTLNNGQSFNLNVIASGKGKLMATIAWTDPRGTVLTTNTIDDPSLKLIHDLDIRITRNATTYFPWILNPANPANAATRGDNFRDNVEKVEVDDVVPGVTYTIIITHKSNLQRGRQAFSLIISGVNSVGYCISTPTSNAGAKIDNVTVGNINNNNAFGCTTYSNFTSQTLQLQASTNYPISIALNSCDASIADKVVKVFIDYNQNGVFTDAGELVASSNVINANTVFNSSFLTPNNLLSNGISIMRVMVQETNDVNSVTSCNTYSKGETQDYRVQFLQTTIDVAMIDIVNPSPASFANTNQYLSVRFKNIGSNSISSGIALTATIKNGATTIATLTGNYAPTINAGKSVVYTFQTPFNTVANTTYNITCSATVGNDQNTINNSKISDVFIANKTSSPTGQAIICGPTALLKAANTVANTNYYWFNSNTSTLPVATGVNTSSSTIAPTYFLNSGAKSSIGISNKNAFGGGYQASGGNYINYTSSVPVLFESTRLFTAFPGKITILVVDITSVDLGNNTYRYNRLDSISIDAIASRPTQQTGPISVNDAADLGQVYNLGLILPAGSHSIVLKTDGIANIFRNNGVTGSPYPFTIPNVFTITENNIASQNAYYYFYDMIVKTLDNPSDRIAISPTTASTPSISKLVDTLTSSVALGYQWIKDDIDIIGANNQKYTVTSNAIYKVRTTDNIGCQLTSAALAVIPTAINPILIPQNEVVVYPNPAKNNVTISFVTSSISNGSIFITDTRGKVFGETKFNNLSGVINKQININHLANGIYILSITIDKRQYRKKIIVLK